MLYFQPLSLRRRIISLLDTDDDRIIALWRVAPTNEKRTEWEILVIQLSILHIIVPTGITLLFGIMYQTFDESFNWARALGLSTGYAAASGWAIRHAPPQQWVTQKMIWGTFGGGGGIVALCALFIYAFNLEGFLLFVGGLAGGLAFGVAVDLAVGLAVDLAIGVTGGLAVSLAGGLAVSMVFGVGFGMAFGVAFGLAFGVSGGLIGGLAFGLTFSLMFDLAFGIAFICGYFHIPFYIAQLFVAFFKAEVTPTSEANIYRHPIFADELIWFPLYWLPDYLVNVATAFPRAGETAIDKVSTSFTHQWATCEARRELCARSLAKATDLNDLPDGSRQFIWLAEEVRFRRAKHVLNVRHHFNQAAASVDIALTDPRKMNRIQQLLKALNEIQNLRAAFR